ncbi:Uncharacterised protein [Collinsella intestinalis]|nr:Uncharacterised protein [Collinsella intestinalis]
MTDARIQIVKRSGDRRVVRITGNERDAARPLLAQDVRRHTSAIGNERRNTGAHEAAAHAAQLESATLGEIDRRARGVERLGHSIQNGVEQRGHIVGAHRGHDHGQRAGKTLVRRLELRQQALCLAVVGILFLEAPDSHDIAMRMASLALGAPGKLDSAHADGNEGAVRKFEHERVLGTVCREGHLVAH